jgi:hypothetical protein
MNEEIQKQIVLALEQMRSGALVLGNSSARSRLRTAAG